MQKLETKATSNKKATNALLGVGVFVFLTILIPFFKLGGGFLTYSSYDELSGSTGTIDFFWDEMSVSVSFIEVGFSYSDFSSTFGFASNVQFVWDLLPIWGFLFLILGILGAVLVAITPLQQLGGSQPSESSYGRNGLIVALIGTGVEYSLFLILWAFEDWGTRPDLNLIILGCFILGWIALSWGHSAAAAIPTSDSIQYSAPSRSVMRPTSLSTKRCPSCSNICVDHATFCEKCGQKFTVEQVIPVTKYCPICSFSNNPEAKFCESCGTPLQGKLEDNELSSP